MAMVYKVLVKDELTPLLVEIQEHDKEHWECVGPPQADDVQEHLTRYYQILKKDASQVSSMTSDLHQCLDWLQRLQQGALEDGEWRAIEDLVDYYQSSVKTELVLESSG